MNNLCLKMNLKIQLRTQPQSSVLRKLRHFNCFALLQLLQCLSLSNNPRRLLRLFVSAIAIERAKLFYGLRLLVMAFEAAFTEHFGGNSRNKFGEGAFDAV